MLARRQAARCGAPRSTDRSGNRAASVGIVLPCYFVPFVASSFGRGGCASPQCLAAMRLPRNAPRTVTVPAVSIAAAHKTACCAPTAATVQRANFVAMASVSTTSTSRATAAVRLKPTTARSVRRARAQTTFVWSTLNGRRQQTSQMPPVDAPATRPSVVPCAC